MNQPIHYALHPDGIRVYRGSELIWTITRDAAPGLILELATMLRGGR